MFLPSPTVQVCNFICSLISIFIFLSGLTTAHHIIRVMALDFGYSHRVPSSFVQYTVDVSNQIFIFVKRRRLGPSGPVAGFGHAFEHIQKVNANNDGNEGLQRENDSPKFSQLDALEGARNASEHPAAILSVHSSHS